MKYFDFNLGDYLGKTVHLSLAEHGAYVLMMSTFYSTEKPLPADRQVLYRLLRAASPAERKAIDNVVGQFWSEQDGKLTNKRCDETLTIYRSWVEKQKANGSRGGRPSLSHGKPTDNPTLNPSVSDGKANGGYRARGITPSHNSENDLDTHTHSDSENTGLPNGQAARVRGDVKKLAEIKTGWKPPTDEEWYAGK